MWVIDEWSANYFHWMTDCLPRIWEGRERDRDCPVILPESYRSLDFVTESLQLIGLKVDFFKSSENVHVDTLILTAKSAEFPNFHEDLVEKTRANLSISSIKEPWRKTYISRKLASKRIANNETEIELLLQKKGFEIVYTEKLTLPQQIKLMGETKILVGLHGAALTNMLFLPREAKVLEMRNFDDDLTHCYFNLASALGLPYYYTLNRGDNKDTIMTNFTIDLEALEEAIKEIESS
ncbi:glycosyltransferase family 61 protein [Algoriphagus boseongensis]|nr:glycosyltransferase 61 family protein [Algoriphagus boseongensis]